MKSKTTATLSLQKGDNVKRDYVSEIAPGKRCHCSSLQ